ncbi:OLC1v1031460C1 [Oldenlandia corymbosa var. corymbosa]|uniref:OLC1v1031460C1 n=1 Tax=Oldenlandia corymbosa var. corymbosa TaxID=529605 RepID=A0AAV1CJF9_OLDCO|nr:OLC1v1031460C1 [Oldenlandia corymbosa var. corymbosa]
MEASKRRLKSVFVTTESDQLTRAYSARKAEERKRSSKNARIAAPEYEYCDAIADLYPKVDKGTAALAFAVKEGVMVAIDHYSSGRANASKEYAGNIINLDTHILVAVSGDVPDPRSFLRDLKTKYLGHNPAGKRSTVKEASYWLADTLCSHSDKGFKVDLLVAGWDKANGSSLYQVNGEGILFQPKFFAIRSGS